MKTIALLLLVGCASLVGAWTSSRPSAPLVVVPSIYQNDMLTIDEVYDRLHKAGFRVGFRRGFPSDRYDLVMAWVASPRPGSHVRGGSTVWLTLGGGPHLDLAYRPTGPTRMPDFRGRTVSRFLAWTNHEPAVWIFHVPPLLHPSRRLHLWDNYRVVAQSPRPGARLTVDPNSGTFDPAVRLRLGSR